MNSIKRTLVAVVLMALGTVGYADIINAPFPITVEQEVPAPTILGLEPAGAGFITYDTDTNQLDWQISYAGLSGPIVAPGAHFHGPALVGQTAGAVVDIAGSLPQPASGLLIGSTVLTEAQEADLLGGLWYVNLHTALNPAGEIRWQVVGGDIIPEPTTFGVLVLGAVGLIFRRR